MALKKITKNELQKKLALHKMYLGGEEGGERADLIGANLIEANLIEANLIEADLRGADLRKADLREADLREADLRGANLRGANLRGANLIEANLIEANLMEANLRGANLTGACLEGAYLIGANLRGANLRGANLIEANLLEANLIEANLIEANLRGAVGYKNNSQENASVESQVTNSQNRIKELENRLADAKLDQEHKAQLQRELDKQRQSNENLKAALDEAEKRLSADTKKQIASLKTSQTNTDEQITSLKTSLTIAKWCSYLGLLLTLIFVVLPLWFIFKDVQLESHALLSLIVNNLKSFSFVIYTFPVIVFLLITSMLFRHQNKLMNEIQHYSQQKNTLELYSGILEASQYMGDTELSKEYVRETFSMIREKLLQGSSELVDTPKAEKESGYDMDIIKELKTIKQILDTKDIK